MPQGQRVMSTVATQGMARGLLRYSNWDALFIGFSVLHLVALVLFPSIPLIALGLWWNSNTISHNFIHLPFFRSNRWNRAYSVFLSALLGYPQSMWRDRHLAHHRGQLWSVKLSAAVDSEAVAVMALWGTLLYAVPQFFLFVYLPGYAIGMSLCYLHGYFEHFGGTISHYGFAYNVTFFNDGYHVEHHRLPGEHWTRLPAYVWPGTPSSSWPAVLRWIERINIETLERIALHSRTLQSFLLWSHKRALRQLLPHFKNVRRITIIGGGMFPRTAIILRELVPDASITIVDARSDHIDTARQFFNGPFATETRLFDPTCSEDTDLVVIPLSFIGDRGSIYDSPSAPIVLVHDWIWSRPGRGAIVSVLLLKRINVVLKLH